jgi:RNA polymerase sigma factor (sigma-70 family)
MVESNSGTRQDAYDVFQDGLISVYGRLKESSLELSGSFETYFIGCCRNIWLMELRRRAKTGNASELHDGVVIYSDYSEELLEKEKKTRIMEESLLKLSGDCQKVILLVQQGKSMQDIAYIMGYKSEEFARIKKHRCKEYLVELVKNHIDYKKM